MIIRRAFYYWQFIAVAVLPLWLVIGWPIFGPGGWQVFGVFLGAVLMGVGLLAVSLLIYARKEVRLAKAVSWPDVAVLAAWHATIIAVGFYADSSPALSVAMVIIGLAAFWFAIWELYSAARKRMAAMMTLIDETAKAPGGTSPFGGPVTPPADPFHGPAATADPNVIIVREKPASE